MSERKDSPEDFQSCQVYFEDFEENGDHVPRILPCHHTLCHMCIGQMLRTDRLECPECRRNFTATERSLFHRICTFWHTYAQLSNHFRWKERHQCLKMCWTWKRFESFLWRKRLQETNLCVLHETTQQACIGGNWRKTSATKYQFIGEKLCDINLNGNIIKHQWRQQQQEFG